MKLIFMLPLSMNYSHIMCIPHATPVSATMFNGLNIPSLVFSTCWGFHPPPLLY